VAWLAAAANNRPMSTRRFLLFVLPLLMLGLGWMFAQQPAPAPAGTARWFKGNLHTHSLWSDGDDYPEMIADWYKQHGYHFLALSDHNVMQEGQRWFEVKPPVVVAGELTHKGGGETLKKYVTRFGSDWVEQRQQAGKHEVRLKPLAEYRALLDEPGRFLMIPGTEASTNWTRPKTETEPELTGAVHVNITNPRELIAATPGQDPVALMQKTIDAAWAQRERTGQPMIPHINHPNFRWGLTVEDMMPLKREQFFEVYNGHAGVNNAGDATRLSTDAMWDALLARRLTTPGLEIMYGLAVDDSHNYQVIGLGRHNSGRGWIMVRARHLTAESIITAMEAGDFYASTGITLSDVRRGEGRLTVEIQPEPGVTYVTQFIGTRRNFDPRTEIMPTPAGQVRVTYPHRRYSPDVGAVLAEVRGPRAEYRLKGDEIYVRAKIVSSKPKENPGVPGEFETAWTQPLVNGQR
jgi:hypothetical protein